MNDDQCMELILELNTLWDKQEAGDTSVLARIEELKDLLIPRNPQPVRIANVNSAVPFHRACFSKDRYHLIRAGETVTACGKKYGRPHKFPLNASCVTKGDFCGTCKAALKELLARPGLPSELLDMDVHWKNYDFTANRLPNGRKNESP